MTIDYAFQLDLPVDVFIVGSESDKEFLSSDDIEHFFPLAEQIQVTTGIGISPHLETYGGIIFFNNNLTRTPTVNMDLLFTFQPSFYSIYNKNKMTVYSLWGKNSVILDPTLDEFGFPGYDAELVGVKKAIDPLTHNYVTLS
jgi:hypothetical protein